MYPTHGELIEFIHLLGYPNYSDGLCFGLVAMSVSSFLTGATEKANLRLQKIKSLLDAYQEMRSRCEKEGRPCCALKQYLDGALSTDEKTDILAYCEGVIFHHIPSKYPGYFNSDQSLEQDLLLTNSIIQSIEAKEKGGVTSAGTATFHHRGSEIIDYLLNLETALTDCEITSSFSLLIQSMDHNGINIYYDATTKQWQYFVINHGKLGHFVADNIVDLTDLIISEFFAHLPEDAGLILTAQAYCLDNNKVEIIQLVDYWRALLTTIWPYCDALPQKSMQQDAEGNTWLAELAMHNDIEGLSYLIENKADVNIPCKNGNTALHVGCHKGHKDVVELLINAGANIHCKSLYFNLPPVMIAAKYKHEKIVQFLIEKGANVHKVDENGLTLLHYAIINSLYSTIDFLFEKGVDINVRDNEGRTPLQYAFDETILEKQENSKEYKLPEEVVVFLNYILHRVLDMKAISKENARIALQIYILLSENENRTSKCKYNSFPGMFSVAGNRNQEKLSAARALLNNEPEAENNMALKSGRLGKIAALFLAAPQDVDQEHSSHP